MTRWSKLVFVAAVLAPAVQAQTVAIVGGTIFPVSGPKIERGTIVMRDGRIVAVGADVAIPAGAERIDATGRWVTPGFMLAASTLGVELILAGDMAATQEDSLEGEVKAAFNLAEGIDPASITIPVARLEGITTAVAAPTRGLIAGQAVLFDLAGERLEDLVVK